MLLNNIGVNDRSNRPTVASKVGLQAIFLSDGKLTDPHEISSVSIFQKSVNMYPSSVFDSDTQLIDTSAVSGSILMNFKNAEALTSDSSFDVSNYNGEYTDIGIYRISEGRYIVVLDGTLEQQGTLNLDGLDEDFTSKVSATGDYIDVWTLRMYEGSELQTVINEFNLRKGGFTVLTEPLMIKTKSRLINSKITLDSKVDIKISSDIHVENTQIDSSIKNLLRENVITNAAIEIQKHNESSNLPSRVTVSSFADTSAMISVTADNVIILNWDTTQLKTHPQLENFGSLKGVYAIRAKFDVLHEKIISDPMYLTLS
jgi:hypothetical protein